jgi:uncharacterized protein YjaZ
MSRSIDVDTKIYYAEQTLQWCRENLGENTRKRTELTFDLSLRNRKMKGFIVYGNYCFWRNHMTIYLPNTNTLYEVVSTIIHEYTHYLQSRVKYREYEKTRYYSQNPMERSAKRNEDRYTKMCLKHIKSNL